MSRVHRTIHVNLKLKNGKAVKHRGPVLVGRGSAADEFIDHIAVKTNPIIKQVVMYFKKDYMPSSGALHMMPPSL